MSIIYNLQSGESCGECGSKDFYIGGNRVWCQFCHSILSEVIKLGLIEGRHSMPVDAYLLAGNMSDSVGFHQGAYDAARQAAIDFVRDNGGFALYLTGLTVAALGAIDGMRTAGISAPVCYNFDRDSSAYERIQLVPIGLATLI